MQIDKAIEGLKNDVYGLKNFLTDTEKELWQEAIDTVLNELEKLIEENKYYKNKFEIVQGDNFPKDVQFVIYTKEVFDKFRNMKLAEEPGNAKTITIKGIKK